MSNDVDYLEVSQRVFLNEIEGLRAVEKTLGEHFCRAAACLVDCKGRCVTTGVGKSGLIAKKIAATFSSVGVPSFFLHPVEAMHGDLGMVCEQDIVLALSNSGETKELLCLMPEISQLRCKSIAITKTLDSSLAKFVDFPIPVKVPREACLLNLAPTASTTAALAIGDALAACIVQAHKFCLQDFHRRHPGGSLGKRLSAKIKDVMSVNSLPSVSPSMPLQKTIEIMDHGGHGSVFVVNASLRLLGVLTDGDLRRALVRRTFDLNSPVSEYMSVNAVKILCEATVSDAMHIMEEHSITSLAVVNNDEVVVGLVHIHDLLGRGSINFRSFV